MTHDAFLPPPLKPPAVTTLERQGVFYTSARWAPADLEAAMRHLAGGAATLAKIADADLLTAWTETVEAFRDPASSERQGLDTALERFCALSSEGLAAALEAVLGGVRGDAARKLLAQPRSTASRKPAVVVLAANLPGLAVQPLLPALVLRRPVLLKSPTAEPLFAPAFAAALTRREPRLAAGVAAVTWPGGDEPLEAPVLAAAGRVLAYGEDDAIGDLERRAPGRVFAYGPKTSLAVLGAEVDPEQVAEGLARDVALFDQRGCLSIQAIYTAAGAEALAEALARALDKLAARWPPGPLDAVAAAAVQQVRTDAALRDLAQPELPLASGTVVVEPQTEFKPSPGLRTVRIHPLPDLDRLPAILAPWSGRLQGAALAGEEAWKLRSELEALGVSRCAAPGELQSPDALWHNGGAHPLAALAG